MNPKQDKYKAQHIQRQHNEQIMGEQSENQTKKNIQPSSLLIDRKRIQREGLKNIEGQLQSTKKKQTTSIYLKM